MRVEPHTVGSYLHVYNRGTRKTKIVRDIKDKWRFMQSLRFFNDSYSSLNVLYQLQKMQRKSSGVKSDFTPQTGFTSQNMESIFQMGWPKNWPRKDPLVEILCYSLVPNHFHLLLKEIRLDGISKFMQKIGSGFTNYFNTRHKETGNLFQGGYKGKLVKEQDYLEYLSVYIQVINVLELFPGGLKNALRNFDKALKFVEHYPFSSYPDYIGLRNSLIINKDVLGEIFSTPKKYKEFAYDTAKNKRYELLEELNLS